MTLKTRFLAAAAALTLPALAVAQQPTPPASAPTATPPANPSTTPPAPSSTTTPPAQAEQDATETDAQQPENSSDDQQAQQSAEAPPPAATPPATTPPTPAPAAQASTTPPAATPPISPAQAVQASTNPPATPPAAAGPVHAATAADLRAGVQVRDQTGALVGTVESADAASAVINTGTARGRLALTSFGRNSQGLVISMSKAQLEAAIGGAQPS